MSPITEPATEPATPHGTSRRGSSGRRQRRLSDYRRQALAHPDALLANLAIINADLMQITAGLGKLIRSALRRSQNPFADCPELARGLQAFTNCARLVQRFTLFDERLRPLPKEASIVPADSTAASVHLNVSELPDELGQQFGTAAASAECE